MMEEPVYSNRELTPDLVPSPDADHSSAIYPFALTFAGYHAWGDQDTCFQVGRQVWQSIEDGEPGPESLTKLRTCLFSAARAMRFIDFDEDVVWDPATMPARTRDRAPDLGSGEVWQQQLRKLVGLIAEQVAYGSATNLFMARAVAGAAERLHVADRWDEAALRVALGESVASMTREQVASSASHHEHSFDALPLWQQAPGPFDLIVGQPDRPRVAAEVKLSKAADSLNHTLWDVLKLLGVLALSAEQVYLVAAYPESMWRSHKFAVLFQDGLLDYSGLPLAKEWPYLLNHSKGTPDRIPNQIEITEIIRLPLARQGERWQLRAVAVEPGPGGWITLTDGSL